MLDNKGVTYKSELERVGKKLIKNFKGVHTYEDMPKLSDGQRAIVNTGGHWIAVFNKDGKLYEWDSFGRDMLGRKYKDYNKKKLQKEHETNCGQRTVSFLSSI